MVRGMHSKDAAAPDAWIPNTALRGVLHVPTGIASSWIDWSLAGRFQGTGDGRTQYCASQLSN